MWLNIKKFFYSVWLFCGISEILKKFHSCKILYLVKFDSVFIVSFNTFMSRVYYFYTHILTHEKKFKYKGKENCYILASCLKILTFFLVIFFYMKWKVTCHLTLFYDFNCISLYFIQKFLLDIHSVMFLTIF